MAGYNPPPGLLFPPELEALARELAEHWYLYLTWVPFRGGSPGAPQRARLDYTPHLADGAAPALLSLGAVNGWDGWGSLRAQLKPTAKAEHPDGAGAHSGGGTWWMYFDAPKEEPAPKPTEEAGLPDFLELFGMFQQFQTMMGQTGPQAGAPDGNGAGVSGTGSGKSAGGEVEF